MRYRVITALLIAAVLAALGYVVFRDTYRPLISSFADCVAAGFPVMESYPRQCSDGTRTYVEEIPRTTTSTASTSGNVRVTSPLPGDTLGSVFTISGEARAFENTVNWRLRDADREIIAEGFATADASDVGQFGSFSITTAYGTPRSEDGTLEVFTFSARDGSVQDLASIPVRFAGRTAAQAFFGSRQQDPETLHCDIAYPVMRQVPPQTPGRGALDALLAGPTTQEQDAGFFTSIPSGTRLLSLDIKDGVATADFSEELAIATGGSCRVSAVRAQIESTLTQFDTVQRVEILISGQPNRLEP